jgi:hypothetical protein
MKQLKTLHVNMNVATTTQTGGAATTTPTTPQAITLNIKAVGDEILPDQASLQLSLNQTVGGQGLNYAQIITGQKLYIQNPKGQWYVLDLATFTGATGNPFASAQASNYNNLLPIAQKATLVDNGNETLNGQTVRHLTATFGKDALNDLLNATGQLNNLKTQQQQQLENILNAINLDKPTLDLWLDPTTAYVQRMELKLTITVNMNTLMTPTPNQITTPANLSSTVDTVIDYSNFNTPVTITAPTNATTITTPATIFQ